MSTTQRQKVGQCLILGAVGDALGVPVEFSRAATIAKTYGTSAPQNLSYGGEKPAPFSDDTQMTLFVAEGLVRAIEAGRADERSHFRAEQARSLVHWLATQDGRVYDDIGADGSALLAVEGLHQTRAPGNTCLTSCRHIYRGGKLPDLDHRINDSKGCGAVMRSAPYGLAAATAGQAFAWARDAGVLTHCHPSGYLSAAYFAALVQALVAGSTLTEAMAGADDLLAEEAGAEETAAALASARQAAAKGMFSFEAMSALGEGWVGEEALALALACALAVDVDDAQSIRQMMWMAARHDGDSDSTAALLGSLIGAMVDDPRVLPTDWIDELAMREVIDEVSSTLDIG